MRKAGTETHMAEIQGKRDRWEKGRDWRRRARTQREGNETQRSTERRTDTERRIKTQRRGQGPGWGGTEIREGMETRKVDGSSDRGRWRIGQVRGKNDSSVTPL